MTGWQISALGKIEKINITEMLDDVDSAKVKLTRTLLTEEDVSLYTGEEKGKYPVIPGRMAVGQVTELGSPVSYFEKGTRVVLSPVKPCGKCYHCAGGDPRECYDFSVAGKNSAGFLKDFAVIKTADIFPLPQSVKDNEAVYTDYIALALSVIDKLDIEKGQHVAIFGGSVFGSILAQLIIYYQGVPILIDENEEALLRAKKSGVYYTLKSSTKTEKEVLSLTGGRAVGKVAFLTRSGLPTDLAFKVAAPSGKIAFAGYSFPNVKIPLGIALSKQLSTVSVTNGYGNFEPAINILANKAVDLSGYTLPLTKMDDIEASVAKMAECYKAKQPVPSFMINMLS